MRSKLVRNCTSSRGQRRGDLSQAWGSYLGSKVFELHIRHPSSGVQYQEDKPLSLFEKQCGLLEGYMKLRLHS